MKRLWIVVVVLYSVLSLAKGQEVVTQQDSTAYYNFLVTPDTMILRYDSVPNPILADSAIIPPALRTAGFVPDPQKSLWYSIAFPGLGQIYNRKYWKLPIVYGGAMGITYAITWNNRTYREYMIGYRDIMDNDPNTNSYLDLLPYGVDPNSAWAQTTLKSRMNTFRRYRDLSIIVAVAFYAITIVDAYVDAQLADFDISPNLSMRVNPTLIESPYTARGDYGMSLAVNF